MRVMMAGMPCPPQNLSKCRCNPRQLKMHSVANHSQFLHLLQLWPLLVQLRILMTIWLRKKERYVGRRPSTRTSWSSRFTSEWWTRLARKMSVRRRGTQRWTSGRRNAKARSNYANRTISRWSRSSWRGERKRGRRTIPGNVSSITVTWACRASMQAVMTNLAWSTQC